MGFGNKMCQGWGQREREDFSIGVNADDFNKVTV